MLAAALVFTLLQPGAQDPDLASALLNDSSRRSVSEGNALASAPADGGARTLSDVTQGATSQIGAAQAAAKQRREAARPRAAVPLVQPVRRHPPGGPGSGRRPGGRRRRAVGVEARLGRGHR